MYAYQLIYTATILSVKLSILTYYVRIFQIRPFRIAVYAVGSLVVVWAITVWFISIFSCRPINGFWDTSVKSSCVSNKEFYVGNAVPNICTDVMILILPLRMVWGLQTTRMQKVTLSGIFLLGGLSVLPSPLLPVDLEANESPASVVVCSCIRLGTQFKVDDPDFTCKSLQMLIQEEMLTHHRGHEWHRDLDLARGFLRRHLRLPAHNASCGPLGYAEVQHLDERHEQILTALLYLEPRQHTRIRDTVGLRG